MSRQQWNEDDDLEVEDDDEISPGDPDYDLSEAAGYAGYEPKRGLWPPPSWLVAAVSILLLIVILLPLLLQFR
ncbi:MAG TPA: hypothetical protein VFB90_08420 [Dehalococcoidia bacterium]|nr:hypothetical protein [Dehalococcoidia bacterium]